MLQQMNVEKFLNELASSSPAPGGGSVAALNGAIGCALIEMVCNLTIGKKKYLEVEDEVKNLCQQTNGLRKKFLELMEKDTQAFNEVILAMKLPKDNEEQKSLRTEKIEAATRQATQIPFEVAGLAESGIHFAKRISEIGNVNSISDSAGAALCLRLAAEEAALNVYINLPGISDHSLTQKYLAETKKKVAWILEEVEIMTKSVQKEILG
jgi:formiminotetrahydrofolate cyclodeaminase